ncbi:putative ADP-ribosylation factor GTPase-activating protein AGD13 [Capsicum chinense]|nr:putative ADP-ribosylation factor GTPase-activating protein AGD13 [Capsicum chinense]
MENLLGLLRVRVKRGVNLAVRDVRSSDPYVVVKMANQVILSICIALGGNSYQVYAVGGRGQICEVYATISFRSRELDVPASEKYIHSFVCEGLWVWGFLLVSDWGVRKVSNLKPLVNDNRGLAFRAELVAQKLKTRVVKKDVNPEWNEDLTLSVADPNHPVKLTVYDHDLFSKDDPMGDAEFDVRPFVEAVRMNLSGLPDGTIITKVQPSRSNCLAEESNVIWKNGQVVQDMCLRLRNVECGEVELQLQWINLPGSRGL